MLHTEYRKVYPTTPTRYWNPGTRSVVLGHSSSTLAFGPTLIFTPLGLHSILGQKVNSFIFAGTMLISIIGKSIAPAPSILNYLKGVSQRHGIDDHIKYRHKVLNLDWSSKVQKWKINVEVGGTEHKIFRARFVIMCTGYYDYEEVSTEHGSHPGLSYPFLQDQRSKATLLFC